MEGFEKLTGVIDDNGKWLEQYRRFDGFEQKELTIVKNMMLDIFHGDIQSKFEYGYMNEPEPDSRGYYKETNIPFSIKCEEPIFYNRVVLISIVKLKDEWYRATIGIKNKGLQFKLIEHYMCDQMSGLKNFVKYIKTTDLNKMILNRNG